MTLTEALDALGSMPDEVAATLLAGGFRGHQRSACRCPVALYANSKAHTMVILLLGRAPAGVPMPEPVRQFIHLFDTGTYPELVAP